MDDCWERLHRSTKSYTTLLHRGDPKVLLPYLHHYLTPCEQKIGAQNLQNGNYEGMHLLIDSLSSRGLRSFIGLMEAFREAKQDEFAQLLSQCVEPGSLQNVYVSQSGMNTPYQNVSSPNWNPSHHHQTAPFHLQQPATPMLSPVSPYQNQQYQTAPLHNPTVPTHPLILTQPQPVQSHQSQVPQNQNAPIHNKRSPVCDQNTAPFGEIDKSSESSSHASECPGSSDTPPVTTPGSPSTPTNYDPKQVTIVIEKVDRLQIGDHNQQIETSACSDVGAQHDNGANTDCEVVETAESEEVEVTAGHDASQNLQQIQEVSSAKTEKQLEEVGEHMPNSTSPVFMAESVVAIQQKVIEDIKQDIPRNLSALEDADVNVLENIHEKKQTDKGPFPNRKIYLEKHDSKNFKMFMKDDSLEVSQNSLEPEETCVKSAASEMENRSEGSATFNSSLEMEAKTFGTPSIESRYETSNSSRSFSFTESLTSVEDNETELKKLGSFVSTESSTNNLNQSSEINPGNTFQDRNITKSEDLNESEVKMLEVYTTDEFSSQEPTLSTDCPPTSGTIQTANTFPSHFDNHAASSSHEPLLPSENINTSNESSQADGTWKNWFDGAVTVMAVCVGGILVAKQITH